MVARSGDKEPAVQHSAQHSSIVAQSGRYAPAKLSPNGSRRSRNRRFTSLFFLFPSPPFFFSLQFLSFSLRESKSFSDLSPARRARVTRIVPLNRVISIPARGCTRSNMCGALDYPPHCLASSCTYELPIVLALEKAKPCAPVPFSGCTPTLELFASFMSAAIIRAVYARRMNTNYRHTRQVNGNH